MWLIIWVILYFWACIQAGLDEDELKEKKIKKTDRRAVEQANNRKLPQYVHNQYTQVNIDKAIIMKGENADEPYHIRTYRRY